MTINVNFQEVKGKDFYNNLFHPSGRVKKEAAVESEYNFAHTKATTFAIKVIKEDCTRGTTDGLINLTDDIQIIQECKIKIKNRNTKAYKEQIIQSLLYAVQLPKTKTVIINSEYHCDYIHLDEITYNKELFLKALEKDPPSKACKKLDVDISNWKIHQRNMPDANITEFWKEIINHYNK